MSANHTPGPWRVGDAGMTIFGPRTDAPSPATIARMSPAADARANARLIAAAPDLLAACEELQRATVLLSNHALAGSEYDSNAVLHALALARAAIAKARRS